MALREATNKLTIIGVVSEVELEETSKTNDEGKKVDSILGIMKIKTGEFNTITLKVYTKKLTNSGTVNKTYEKLKGFLDGDYPTLAKDPDNATIVRITGDTPWCAKIVENRYANVEQNTTVTNLRFSLGFGKITIDNTIPEEEFKAEFEVEMFVKEIEDETDKDGEDTGRVVVKGLVPFSTADGMSIFPITFVAGKVYDPEYDVEEDVAEGIRDEFEIGDTVTVFGSINYQRIVERKVKKGIGRAKVDETYQNISELVIEGGEVVRDDGKEGTLFEEDDVRTAVKERTIELENILAEAKAKANNVGNAGKKRGIASSGRNKEEKTSKSFDF